MQRDLGVLALPEPNHFTTDVPGPSKDACPSYVTPAHGLSHFNGLTDTEYLKETRTEAAGKHRAATLRSSSKEDPCMIWGKPEQMECFSVPLLGTHVNRKVNSGSGFEKEISES